MTSIPLMIVTLAQIHGVDPTLALSVARLESKLNPNAIGSVGEIGLFQIRPEYSRYTRKDLFNPRRNTLEGLRLIKEAQSKCVFRTGINFMVCYNYGSTNALRVKYPDKFPYIRKLAREMQMVQRISYNYDGTQYVSKLAFIAGKQIVQASIKNDGAQWLAHIYAASSGKTIWIRSYGNKVNATNAVRRQLETLGVNFAREARARRHSGSNEVIAKISGDSKDVL